MDILMKILAVVLWAAAVVWLVVFLDRKIARLADARWQALARAFLYAMAFTPTAYHHAPNTIVAPLHLSTVCGNLFYAYEHTIGMFVYGVVVPVACSWVLLTIIFLYRKLPRLA
jgi:hypothetical protein